MKLVRLSLVAILVVGGAGFVQGGEQPGVKSRVLNYCDPVCEIESQDAAYSLLMECYQQHKAYRIQSVYESRVSAASAMSAEHGSLLIQADSEGMRTLRAWVLELADQERELSLKELQGEVDRFRTAYGCARRGDEDRIGQYVSNKLDRETASAQLQSYSIIAVGELSPGGVRTIKPISAKNVLLKTDPAIAANGPHIEPCD